MMLKKLVIATAILAASSTLAFARVSYKGEHDYKAEQPLPAPCPTYQFMAGPYVGASIGPISNMSGQPAAYRGFSGIISAGYGMFVYPSFYLAGEIFTGSNAQIKDFNGGNPALGVKTGWTWGGSLIPGYMITDHVLGYLRVGGQRARFNDAGVNASGWHVGLGGQTSLTQNLDIRAEYVYNQYRNVNNSTTVPAANRIGTVMSDQVNVGLVYKFL